MNIGMAIAQGQLLARVDQDDLPRADRFEKQVDLLRRDAAITVVGSQVEHFGATASSVSVHAEMTSMNIETRRIDRAKSGLYRRLQR
jgi:hypothetical protein